MLRCEICNKIIENVYGERLKTARFCSRKCKGVWQKTIPPEKHFNWKGGKIINYCGYVLIRINGKYIYEHRYIMEQYLGRKLKKNEVVHHINNIRTDNRIENLKLLVKQEHDRIETIKRWKLGKFINNIRKRPDVTFKKIEFYLIKGYSIRKIANVFKVCHHTITNRIKKGY